MIFLYLFIAVVLIVVVDFVHFVHKTRKYYTQLDRAYVVQRAHNFLREMNECTPTRRSAYIEPLPNG